MFLVCRHFSPQRGVHGVRNLGGVVRTLRRSNSLSRSIFTTVGSFGYSDANRKKQALTDLVVTHGAHRFWNYGAHLFWNTALTEHAMQAQNYPICQPER